MKLIITGANGFIGNETLNQALKNPAITSVIALARKPLVISDPKLQVVIVNDYLNYPAEALSQLESADACIWTIGAKALRDREITQRVTVDYTLYAARTFISLQERRQQSQKKPFRFLFTSGKLSESDASKTLWLFGDVRKISGSIETQLLDLAKEHPESLDAIVVKPAAVLTKEGSVMNTLLKTVGSINVDELAAASLNLVTEGIKGEKRVFNNGQLVARGREVLARK